MITDPVADVMTDRLEEEVRNRLLARVEWDVVKVCYRGEPGIVPVRLYPFGVVFITTETESLGEDGYARSTGPTRSNRYDGFVTVEVLVPDTAGLLPDIDRKANINSYLTAKKLIQAAKQAFLTWAAAVIDGAVILSADGRERLSDVRVDRTENALSVRPNETVANTSTMAFHLFTRRQEY